MGVKGGGRKLLTGGIVCFKRVRDFVDTVSVVFLIRRDTTLTKAKLVEYKNNSLVGGVIRYKNTAGAIVKVGHLPSYHMYHQSKRYDA